MLTIKMLSDKSLIMTTQSKLYQRQSLVDTMQILVPSTYDDVDLTTFTATLDYIDPGNIAYMEILTADEDLYKDAFIRYTLPLDSKFTAVAGTVTMKITLTYYDESTMNKYVLKTGEIQIEVNKINDYFAYVTDESISTIDNKIMQLQAETDKIAATAEIYAQDKVDDLVLEEDILHVSANGKALGNGVEILVNPVDDDSNPYDGQINLDDYTEVDLG